MRTINMRQLRDTRRLESWLEKGESLRLVKRRRPLADIVPIDKQPGEKRQQPDFEARLKTIFGDRVLNVIDEFVEDRNRW